MISDVFEQALFHHHPPQKNTNLARSRTVIVFLFQTPLAPLFRDEETTAIESA
jgi:hypothetical protein